MTENKRFTAEFDKQYSRFYDNGEEITKIEVVLLLNKLHEENIRLKRDFDSCSHNWALMYDEAKDIVNALHEENEQFKDALNQRTDQCDKYYKENEQLKQQVQKIHKLINSKIQSARELGSVRTVIALKNLQRELIGDMNDS